MKAEHKSLIEKKEKFQKLITKNDRWWYVQVRQSDKALKKAEAIMRKLHA